jgi:hypothetical protein
LARAMCAKVRIIRATCGRDPVLRPLRLLRPRRLAASASRYVLEHVDPGALPGRLINRPRRRITA